MLTYQDLLLVEQNEDKRMAFVAQVIDYHKMSDLYETAEIAEQYDRHENKTIVEFQKLLYTVTGKAVPDNYSANYKLRSRFFNRFVTQQNQYLLGNGIEWNDEATEEALGEDFDIRVQEAGHAALVGGVSFGFWNFDHLEVFKVTEFAPLYDEEDGSLKAGVRWWQIDDGKPLRATLYELDGYTDYMWTWRTVRNKEYRVGEVVHAKRPYIVKVAVSAADGERIYDGENYLTFPIVPLWANPHKQSELVGMREQIDAYDLIKSGFANTVDEASFVYWTLQNAGGMDDVDLTRFVERMKTVHAAVVEEGQAESHTLEAPYASREALLNRLERDMYKDFMALDTDAISGGAVTATQIRAAYEPMNNKADQYEYCVIDFIQGILALAGIDDDPTFTRSTIVNTQEELELVISAATYLDEEYVTRKILALLGDADQADEVLRRMTGENYERFEGGVDDAGRTGEEAEPRVSDGEEGAAGEV